MKTIEANIEIKRENGILSFISVIMPTWNKMDDNDCVSVNIPLFGLKTIAKDETDADAAIMELIKCFSIASEKFGQGIEKELETLGWSLTENSERYSLLTYGIEQNNVINNVVLEQIMETGEQFAKNNLVIA